MVCPYAVNRKIVIQTTFEHDDDGKQTMQQTVEAHANEFLTCAGERCGAWKDGRCCYRGTE